MKKHEIALIIVFCGLLLLVGCATTPGSAQKQAQLTNATENAIQVAKKTDPGLQRFFDTATGYAVFPAVGKGGIGVGGAYGRGQLYEDGKPVGFCTLTQASIGFQLGGQKYTELIFFETPYALNNFKSGNFAFAA